jgi:hypothetical protein
MNQTFIWSFGCIGLFVIFQFFRFIKRNEIELKKSFQGRFSKHEDTTRGQNRSYHCPAIPRLLPESGHGLSGAYPQELYFKMQLFNREITIPASSLLSVGETRRMLGKNPLRAMLKVDFKTIDGKEDAIALIVKDLPHWKTEILHLINKSQ